LAQNIWRLKAGLPELYMTPCKIVGRGKRNTCLIEFEDGCCVAMSRNYVIKLETLQKRLAGRSSKK
jgi:hypothetical protein